MAQDHAALRALLDRYEPRLVVNAAGPADVASSFAGPEEDFREQLLPLVDLAGAIRSSTSRPQLLHVSSAAVYGEPGRLPVRESDPVSPLSPYGYHKAMQEWLIAEHGQLFGLRCCIARVFSAYGPGQRRLAIWEMAQRARRGDYSVRGTGDETRDYLFVEDVGRALVSLAQSAPFRGEVVNVASGTEVTVRRAAASIYRALGIDARPVFDRETMPGAPSHWRADVTVLQSLGFQPRTSFDAGIAVTAEWIAGQ